MMTQDSHLTRRRFGYLAYGVLAVAAVSTATGFSIKKGAAAGDLSANLTLIAPAGAGGGWDGFARETQQAMRLSGVTNNAQVLNIPGAGGTIGLGKFATMDGRADTVLATGSAMTGGIALNKSPVGYKDATLLARVAEDYDVLITANDSPYQSMDQLVGDWKSGKKFKWTGGSAGSIDHLTVAQIARVNDIDPGTITYIPKSGGGEAIATLLSHTTDFACTGYNEVSDQVEAGRVRALGLAAPKRIAGIDIPTMTEQGHKVTMTNWRGYLGAPGISEDERAQLIDILDATRKSEAWQDALKRNQWTDVWLTGPEFESFIAADQKQTDEILKELGL
ncbi:tripartite tricarboxylate transporter substrate-binding protein [Brevibacterium sp. 91QC2O2]|jgi:putative tricarboxylic transport membrane protein|uniref:Bug family tripartite tricarboxylate transporter substrate binding protein n=1 Tax=Brevibacterium sp. 91QC2O2 TaxID=2968458 RepID=UPI00211C4C91|nr:tripartite tricarboxylate transporter substrate-binding protein [Brevibacterium sp. 91QC2O2]MCQ9368070.1 tripartite tricarboxylate transporter substrate-binding protein [Brevibacterium sp. 91QC2O2]